MTKLDDALVSVISLGLDTSPFIYFVECDPLRIDVAREVFRRVDTGVIVGFCSVITLTEVLTQPKRAKNVTLENEYRSLLLSSRNLSLVTITPAIADRASDLRATYRLRTPDALQIAAALDSGCEAFLTNDFQLKRVAELRVLVLDELELSPLCRRPADVDAKDW